MIVHLTEEQVELLSLMCLDVLGQLCADRHYYAGREREDLEDLVEHLGETHEVLNAANSNVVDIDARGLTPAELEEVIRRAIAKATPKIIAEAVKTVRDTNRRRASGC